MFQVSTCWTESSDAVRSLRFIKRLALLSSERGGTVGQQISDLVFTDNFQGLLDFEIDYSADWDVIQLAACRQALAYYQKFDSLDIGVDRKAVAKAVFLEAEEHCKTSNDFFRGVSSGSINLLPADCVLFEKARRSMRRVLGKAPSLGQLGLRFGPGATTSVKKKSASACEKLAEQPSCSLELYSSGLLPELFRQIPHWLDCHEEEKCWSLDGRSTYSVVEVSIETGRTQFVPKNAKTDRTIDSQPTLNTLVQAGVGDYLFNRLRSVGLNLRDQCPNRDAAKKGSLDGLTSTIDLKSASDLISIGLVKFLLPDDWFDLLSACRCGSTVLDGNVISLNKFCAMGNGFTFPLETLIFWALTTAAVSGPTGFCRMEEVLVYGDDIICPTRAYGKVVRILQVAGFRVNEAKSFCTGFFRESCGADFYKGTSVRPFYCRTVVSGRTLFLMHNHFARLQMDEECAIIRTAIPKAIRRYGPDGYGDGHLISSSWQPKLKAKLISRGFGGVFFSTYVLPGRFVTTRYPGDYVTPLYTIYSRGERPSSVLEVDDGNAVRFRPDGRPEWPVPSVDGRDYERKDIYTFQRS